MAGVERFATTRYRRADYDLVASATAVRSTGSGSVGVRHADLFGRLPRVVIDHHASNAGGGRCDWVDPAAAATCEMVALLAARLGYRSIVGDGAMAANLMAGIVMDTATFAHPNATPRTLDGRGGARRGRRAAVRHLPAPLPDKPDAQLRLFGRVLDRLEPSDDGRIVWSS